MSEGLCLECNETLDPSRQYICKICAMRPIVVEPYKIICIKDCYVGQGLHYGPGDIVRTFLTKYEAEAYLELCNSDPWAPNCFKLIEDIA